VPIEAHPEQAPAAWDRAAALGRRGVAVIRLPIGTAHAGSPAGPGSAPAPRRPGARSAPATLWWTSLGVAIDGLVRAGVHVLGQVSLGYATRPMLEVVGELTRWSRLPVTGVFLDHAPAGPFQVGPVAHAARVARRAGLPTVVVNPGVPVGPPYRRLGATLCTFEGSWTQYRECTGEGMQPGDGHLVYGVPRGEADAAWRLLASRRAGLGQVSEHHLGHGAPVRPTPPPTPAPTTGLR
jgi:Spherulation-specific family 4